MTPFDDQPNDSPPPRERAWALSPPTGEEPALLEGRPARGNSLLAWFAIIGVTVLVAVLQQIRPEVAAAANAPAPAEDAMGGIFDLQARYLVGLGEFLADRRQEVAAQVKTLETGSVRQRLRAAVIQGELGGPREALESLERLNRSPDFRLGATEKEKQSALLLSRLYTSYVAEKFAEKAMPAEDRAFLVDEMGWYGELALAPRNGPDSALRLAVLEPANRVVTGMLAGLAGGCGGLVLGLGLLILLIMVLAGGPHKRGFKPGSENSGLYAETFAIWMIVFVGLQVALQFAFQGEVPVVVMALAPLGTLLVLHWPVMRGAKWEDVRRDVGLTFGKRPLAEVLSGPMTWLAAIPLVALGVVVVVLVMIAIYGKMPMPEAMLAQMPMHPIVLKLRDADAGTLFFLFFAACVTAPVVEEVFFRGIFFRHLREGTNRWGFGWSLVASLVVSSFIFAAVHPQGLIGIPLLMPLAIAFAMAREWRGSLVACMVAHAINNGLVLLLAVNIFGK